MIAVKLLYGCLFFTKRGVINFTYCRDICKFADYYALPYGRGGSR